jgi:hypothetical protein
MTKIDMMKLANETAPELMQKTAANLHELGTLSEAFAREAAGEMSEILDYVGGQTKEAGVGSWAGGAAKAVGRGLGDVGVAGLKAVGATVVAGLGLALATDLYNASKRGLTTGRNWKRMMQSNPTLKDHPPAEVRRAFKMVQEHAPDVASDPMAAGALVYNVVSSGDLPGTMHTHLSTMVKAQREKAESMYSPFQGLPKPIFDSHDELEARRVKARYDVKNQGSKSSP